MTEYNLIRCATCGRLTPQRGTQGAFPKRHVPIGRKGSEGCPGYLNPGEPVNLVDLIRAQLPDTCENVSYALGVSRVQLLVALKELEARHVLACERQRVRPGQWVKMWRACAGGAQAKLDGEFGKGVE